jgi:hypothetical protein
MSTCDSRELEIFSIPHEAHRNALRERVKASLPADSDRKIRLTARAWAVQRVV